MKRFAPAAERNRQFIIDVLSTLVPKKGHLLELASGTGQHAVAFARAFPGLEVQPSDLTSDAFESIRSYQEEAALPNLAAPVLLDARDADWPVERSDVVVSINMIHISPWSATEGLIDGAARTLSEGGLLYLYGPLLIDGAPTTDSNAAFDASLRERDAAWGIRDLRAVTDAASAGGFERILVQDMPANNFSVAFRRAPGE